MNKVLEIIFGYVILKKYPNIDKIYNKGYFENLKDEDNVEVSKEKIKKHELYFIFEDNTAKMLSIYEPHGVFKFKEYYIAYGHENIKIYDESGTELINKTTR